MSAPTRVVVVGFGPVGARFAEEILPAVTSGDVTLTVIGQEKADAYNRVLVAEYAVGRTDVEAMTMVDGDDLRRAGASVRTGVSVTSIDRRQRRVHLDDGSAVAYDRLVLATGARANVPTLDGVARVRRDLAGLERADSSVWVHDDPLPSGVTVLRDLDDAITVQRAVRSGRRIVILGAGVLGLEIALAAAAEGAEVCVVHHGGFPMPRNLDRGGGTVLTSALRASGVGVVAHSRAEAILFSTDEGGGRHFSALVTADGKSIPGDLLLLSCGVNARSDLAALAGLRVAAGIVVGPDLRSWSDDAIYAIGDCAHVIEQTPERAHERVLAGGPSGLIGPGWRQAEWLASRLSADARAAGADTADAGARGDTAPAQRQSVVMLKAENIDVVAVGDVSADPWEEEHPHPAGIEQHAAPRRVSQWADPEHGRYVKMVTRQGVLEGFVAVGMPRTAAELTLLFERSGELPADRSILLRLDGPDSGSASATDVFAPDATVCWCNGVTVGAIERSAEEGNTTVACIGRSTRAGTGCGGCRGRISELLAHVAPTGASDVAV
ncbi:FAD-dependent oxidoreductase [Okibacterium endophyticum]